MSGIVKVIQVDVVVTLKLDADDAEDLEMLIMEWLYKKGHINRLPY